MAEQKQLSINIAPDKQQGVFAKYSYGVRLGFCPNDAGASTG